MADEIRHSVAIAALQVQPFSAFGLQKCLFFADLASYALSGQGLLPEGSWTAGKAGHHDGPVCLDVCKVMPSDGDPIQDTSTHTVEDYKRALLSSGSPIPAACNAATPLVELVAQFVNSMTQQDLNTILTQRPYSPWYQGLVQADPEHRMSQDSETLVEYATHPVRKCFFHLLGAASAAVAQRRCPLIEEEGNNIWRLRHQSQQCLAKDMTRFVDGVDDFMRVVKTEEEAESVLRHLAAESDEFVQWPGASWKQLLWSHLLLPANIFESYSTADANFHPNCQVLFQEVVKRNPYDQLAKYHVDRYVATVRRIQDETRQCIGSLDKDVDDDSKVLPDLEDHVGKVEERMIKKLPTLKTCASLAPFHRYVLGLMMHSMQRQMSTSFSEEVWSIEPRHNRSQLALLACGLQCSNHSANLELARVNANCKVCFKLMSQTAVTVLDGLDQPASDEAAQAEVLLKNNFVTAAVEKVLTIADSNKRNELLDHLFPNSSVVPQLFAALERGDDHRTAAELICHLAINQKCTEIDDDHETRRLRDTSSCCEMSTSVAISYAWLSKLCQLGQPIACVELARLAVQFARQECSCSSCFVDGVILNEEFQSAWERKAVAYLQEAGPILASMDAVMLFGSSKKAYDIFFKV